jgi:imidazole glycerol-phosphate synthase subunit HisF
MLFPRVIPCLLVHQNGLFKTVNFKNPKYVGDPINAVKIFNEKEVDELIVIDIDATVHGLVPNYKLIGNLAEECRMPFCYGGGIKTIDQAEKIFRLGVEKIAVSSVVVENPSFVTELAEHVGKQSVVVVMDVRKRFLDKQYEIWTYNGTHRTNKFPIEFAVEMEKMGAGEIVINSIDNDGIMGGYDLNLIQKIREAIRIPMTVLGGAGSLDDIGKVISKHGIIGVAAGSFFVFKGKYKAVLINYPSRSEKDSMIKKYFLNL